MFLKRSLSIVNTQHGQYDTGYIIQITKGRNEYIQHSRCLES